MSTALVLAGGGVAGIAWELGVLRGVVDVHPGLESPLLTTDVVVGTSAGSTVAAQITSGTPLDLLYEAQLSPTSSELEVDVDLMALFAELGAAIEGVDDPVERQRRIGALALAADTVPEAARHAAVAARLPLPTWPDRDLRIPAVDALTGELTVFTRDSGVDLADAVAASCAVPGVWPPVTIDGRRYVDGGVRSVTNADLAVGERVLVITPSLPGAPVLAGDLDAELAGVAHVHVVFADDESVAAFGANPLSADSRGPSARAGRVVGREHADAVAALFA